MKNFCIPALEVLGLFLAEGLVWAEGPVCAVYKVVKSRKAQDVNAKQLQRVIVATLL